jgi:hypothetical protein
MKRIVLAVFGLLGLVALPRLSWAQAPVDCPDCVLGIWDDPDLNKNFGTVTAFVPKDIYIGVRLAAGQTGITGLEFSVTGLTNADGVLVTGVEGATEVPPSVLLGSPPAPADTTSSSTGTGGMNAAWPSCIAGSGALLKVSLLPLSPAPNKILRVMHKFNPTNPNYGLLPIIIGCDNPTFTPARVTGGCYVLNWDGQTNPTECPLIIGVEPKTWTGVKTLYN